MAGLSAAGLARSRFRPWPTPATPVTALERAIRAGLAPGSPDPCVASATAGLSTFVGEASMADCIAARAGRRLGDASGLRLGGPVDVARRAVARAISVEALAACTSCDCWLRAALGLLVACRATVADDGRGWSVAPRVGAMFAATSAVTVVALGRAAVDCRRVSDEMRAWATLGASPPRGTRVAERDTPPAACAVGAATDG